MKAVRKHRRYALDAGEVTARMLLSSIVEVIDISPGGIALKVGRSLNVGSQYNLKLEDRRGSLYLRGVVVRSSLSEIRHAHNGDVIPIYIAGLKFIQVSGEKAGELLAFIELHSEERRVAVSDRLKVGFNIIVSEDKKLHWPDSYRIKQVSRSGMLIECVEALEIKNRRRLELSLYEDETVIFEGIVNSCGARDSSGQYKYIIGVDFLDLTDKDLQVLNAFMAHHSAEKAGAEAENKTSEKTKAGVAEELRDNLEYLYNWHKTLGYYKLLGIQEHASQEVIKRAYYSMARKFHQDMHPGVSDDLKDKMNVLFTYINAAYVTLSDPQKRQEYDRTAIRKDKTIEV